MRLIAVEEVFFAVVIINRASYHKLTSEILRLIKFTVQISTRLMTELNRLMAVEKE